jgi:hypothetical protein
MSTAAVQLRSLHLTRFDDDLKADADGDQTLDNNYAAILMNGRLVWRAVTSLNIRVIDIPAMKLMNRLPLYTFHIIPTCIPHHFVSLAIACCRDKISLLNTMYAQQQAK